MRRRYVEEERTEMDPQRSGYIPGDMVQYTVELTGNGTSWDKVASYKTNINRSKLCKSFFVNYFLSQCLLSLTLWNINTPFVLKLLSWFDFLFSTTNYMICDFEKIKKYTSNIHMKNT